MFWSKNESIEIDEEELWWYLDTRRFGSAVHSGFGFERKIICNWNDEHTRRDSFPRTPLNAEFNFTRNFH
jgi:asparaginyl-tRNA synthetase